MDAFQLNYNYVVLGADGYYLAGYSDIMNLPNVKYYTDYYTGFESMFSRKIVRLNFSRNVNKYFHTPFKRFVYPKLFPHKFNDDKPVCYLFFAGWSYIFNSSYIDYLKEKDKNSKFVLYLQDLVCRNRYLDIDSVRPKMDLILSYDQGDCKKYGLLFYPTPMSKSPFIGDNIDKTTDFYFCGKAKGRFEIVHNLFKELTSRGYKCDFNILEMPRDVERLTGINYPSKQISYQDNITHVINTKCIVEIMQEGADGFTPRLWESIMSDCHLLSNNTSIEKSRFYIPENIHIINDDLEKMDLSWLSCKATYEDALKEELSPINFLKYIDRHLSK